MAKTYHIAPADPDGCALGCLLVMISVVGALAIFAWALAEAFA